jgi:hypothetical protein
MEEGVVKEEPREEEEEEVEGIQVFLTNHHNEIAVKKEELTSDPLGQDLGKVTSRKRQVQYSR